MSIFLYIFEKRKYVVGFFFSRLPRPPHAASFPSRGPCTHAALPGRTSSRRSSPLGLPGADHPRAAGPSPSSRPTSRGLSHGPDALSSLRSHSTRASIALDSKSSLSRIPNKGFTQKRNSGNLPVLC